jgi:hypothetical protein
MSWVDRRCNRITQGVIATLYQYVTFANAMPTGATEAIADRAYL